MNNFIEFCKERKQAITNLIIMLVAVINGILTMFGMPILPISSEEIVKVLSSVILLVASLWTWWKNSPWTKASLTADRVMRALKKGFINESDLTNNEDNKLTIIE